MKYLAYLMMTASADVCNFDTIGLAATGFAVTGTGTATAVSCTNVAGTAANSAAGKACDAATNSNTKAAGCYWVADD